MRDKVVGPFLSHVKTPYLHLAYFRPRSPLSLASTPLCLVVKVDRLTSLKRLIILDTSGNPMCSSPHFRLLVLFKIPKLKVVATEKYHGSDGTCLYCDSARCERCIQSRETLTLGPHPHDAVLHPQLVTGMPPHLRTQSHCLITAETCPNTGRRFVRQVMDGVGVGGTETAQAKLKFIGKVCRSYRQ